MRNALKHWLLIGLIGALSLSLPALAGPTNCVLVTYLRLLHPERDSAIELEMSLDERSPLLDIFTTLDGKVGSLFEGVVLPNGFERWAKATFANGKDWRAVEFDSLTRAQKLNLMQNVSGARPIDFKVDRTFYGIVIKKEITLTFPTETRFLGKTYPPGSHVIDVSSVLGHKVEYRGPQDIKGVNGVELHFRGNQTAGQMSTDARTFQAGLGLKPTHQHAHLVAQIPYGSLRAAPVARSALMGDFVRRVNLGTEMMDIVEEGMPISAKQKDDFVYFDSLSPKNIEGITYYFLDTANGHTYAIGDQFKMGWVGMRGADKYDIPGLWGIEVRAIGERADPVRIGKFLDAVQYQMTNDTYGVAQNVIERWIRHRKGKWFEKPLDWIFRTAPRDIPIRMREIHYNQEWDLLFHQAAQDIPPSDLAKFRTLVTKNGLEKNKELKMLLFDWSGDTLIFENKALQRKIAAQQRLAIRKLLEGKPINDVMKEFLRESGLYETVLNSIGFHLIH